MQREQWPTCVKQVVKWENDVSENLAPKFPSKGGAMSYTPLPPPPLPPRKCTSGAYFLPCRLWMVPYPQSSSLGRTLSHWVCLQGPMSHHHSNSSGLKSNFQIQTIKNRNTYRSFQSICFVKYSFINLLFAKLLKPQSWMHRKQQQLSGPVNYWDSQETGPSAHIYLSIFRVSTLKGPYFLSPVIITAIAVFTGSTILVERWVS